MEGNWFEVWLPMEPPHATHQAKKIARRFSRKSGRMVPTLVDRPELERARNMYFHMLVASGRRPPQPLKGAISLELIFAFKGDTLGWYIQKPDRDNCEKTLIDALVNAGFIADDKTVCTGPPHKITAVKPYVYAYGVEIPASPAVAIPNVPPPASVIDRFKRAGFLPQEWRAA